MMLEEKEYKLFYHRQYEDVYNLNFKANLLYYYLLVLRYVLFIPPRNLVIWV